MVILLCAFMLFVLSMLFIAFKSKRKYRDMRKRFRCLPSLPIIGSAYLFQNPKHALEKVMGFLPNYGEDFILYLFHKPYLLITSPKLVEFVLGSSQLIDKSDEYKFMNDWFGTGLLTSTGEKWKTHRKILTPSFHYKILEEFVKVFDEKSFILVEKLKENAGKDSFDVLNPISFFTLDIICETAMGTKVNAQEDPDSPFVSSVKNISSILFKRLVTPLRYDWIFFFSKEYRVQKKCLRVLTNFSQNIIQQRRQVIETLKIQGHDEDIGTKRRHYFLDALLLATINGNSLTDGEIREEVDTFIFEGHDTTSVAISFCLYLLSKHQEVQERVYSEVVEVIGKNKFINTTFDNLQEMKYLEKVVKETLRLYPSVSLLARKLYKDVEFDGTLFPAGITVVPFPYGVHRNPNLYPDPDRFDPERFTPEESAKRHPYAYIPFSAGPRNCIGQKFAMLELKCTIAKLLRHYKILSAGPDYKVKPMATITLESSNGIRVRLEDR